MLFTTIVMPESTEPTKQSAKWGCLKVFLALVGLAATIQTCSYLLQDSQQRAISQCVDELNDAADGGFSLGELNRTCAQMCSEGKLEGCK